ncbi:hypothetical protein AMK16_28830 [Streptomyces sp. CB00455]|nr:hypothetical protein AMK16_28830 [Streptomyces sp. CB00455]
MRPPLAPEVVAAVASTTAHAFAEPDADGPARDPSVLSGQVGPEDPALGTVGPHRLVLSGMWPLSVRYSDIVDRCRDTSALLGPMTTTSSRTLATEATMTPGARCMCRMRAF